jgi:hypothetical protein
MTMPHERLRSLRFGREALVRIAADASLDRAVQQHAAWLLDRYPAMEDIDRIDGLRYGGMRLMDVEVLDGALALFNELAREGGVDEELRRQLWGVLRNFPERMEISALRTIRGHVLDSQGNYDVDALVKLLETRVEHGDAVLADRAELSLFMTLQRSLDEARQRVADLQEVLRRRVEATTARLR